jgi:1,4-alpha-glucan branching enzyme
MMGEEIGAQRFYRYSDFLSNREDLLGERQGEGQRLFRFYQDIIRLRLEHSGLRSHQIDIIHVHNTNRIIAFRRWDNAEELLVVASLNNSPFSSGYAIENSRLGNGTWREIFNSDAEPYGGNRIGNLGGSMASSNGRIYVVVPANGFVVFQRL